jgi:DcuC family C4-dicarboxylate transporter
MTLLLGLVVIVVAVAAVLRKVDVRLVLTLAALALGIVAGLASANEAAQKPGASLADGLRAFPAGPALIVRTFLSTFSSEQFVVPLGCAVGFAYVLRHTGCEQHLVQLLVRPLRRARVLLIPGVVLVGFAVNVPVISQVGTAVSIGAVLVPLLRAARVSAVTTGAALLLGCSLGGDLLNPGAPEWRTVAEALGTDSRECVARVFWLLLLQVGVATPVFWVLSVRAERAAPSVDADEPAAHEGKAFRVNYVKALVPLVPLVLLFLTGPPLRLIEVPRDWLTDPNKAGDAANFASRLIGAAMLIGVVAASAVAPAAAPGTARAFFEGAGYAMTNIVSLIVAAACFGKGVEGIGVKDALGRVVGARPGLLLPAAGVLPLGFAAVCGSGMATTQALFGFFVDPARAAGTDPLLVGSVVAITASAGRTMSPVAAIVLMSASLTGSEPLAMVRRVVVPLACGVVAVLVAAALMAG